MSRHGDAYLFIGDLQENLAILPALLKQPEYLIFMGDIFDSFHFRSEQHIEALDTILDLVEQRRAALLMGNHEASYLWPQMRASGWRPELHHAMQTRQQRYLRLVSRYWYSPEEHVLATHAGLTRGWYEQKRLRIGREWPASTLRLNAAFDPRSWWFAIGRTRGGIADWGGPLWVDWLDEFEPVPGLRQIVGHTARLGTPRKFHESRLTEHIRVSDNGDFNVDCLARAPVVLRWDPDRDVFSEHQLAI